MTKAEQRVYDLCKKITGKNRIKVHQITIDTIEDVQTLLAWNGEIMNMHEMLGAEIGHIAKLNAVFNPVYDKEMAYLTEVLDAMDQWLLELENTNKILREFKVK